MSPRPASILLSTVFCAALLCLSGVTGAADLRYTVNPMPPLPYDGVDHVAGIDNAGNVFGTVYRARGEATEYRGFRWSGNSIVPVEHPGMRHTWINAVNDHGAFTGIAWSDTDTVAYVAGGANGDWARLPNQSDVSTPSPRGINNRMQVAGSSTFGPADQHAFLWSDGAMQDLGTLGGSTSRAEAINDNGMVTGRAQTANGQMHAFLYVDGVMHDLGVPGSGRAINNVGTIVGDVWVDQGASPSQAFIHRDGVTTLLGTMAGIGSSAGDINDQGWIVGTITMPGPTPYSREYHGFLYLDGTMFDLNTLVDPGSGWRIRRALAVNDNGQIVAEACRASGACRYAVLTAVPEAGQWAMLAAGLALLAVRRRFHNCPRAALSRANEKGMTRHPACRYC